MVIAESEHYALVGAPLNPYYDINDKDYTLRLLEEVRAKGYRPLHYENRQKGFVCEKVIDEKAS